MLPGVVLAALVAVAAAAGRFGRPAAILLAGVSVLWLFVDKPMEGRTLIVFSEYHGLTAADLGGLSGILLAVVLFAFPRHGSGSEPM